MTTPWRILTGAQKIAVRSPNRVVAQLHGGRALEGLAPPQPLPGRYTLTAESVLDFETDWSCLLVAGETLTSATFTVLPSANGTLTLSNESFTDTTSTVWVGPGGVPGEVYHVAAGVVTSQHRSYDQDLTFRILPSLIPSVGGVLGGSGTLSCAGNLGYNGVFAPFAVGFALSCGVSGSGQLSASAVPSWRLGGSGRLTSAAYSDEFQVVGSLHGGGDL